MMNNSTFKSDMSDVKRFLENASEKVNKKLEQCGKVSGKEINDALNLPDNKIVPNDYIWESDEYVEKKRLLREKCNISSRSLMELEALKDACEEELWIRSLLAVAPEDIDDIDD